jgi:hypothetical protein
MRLHRPFGRILTPGTSTCYARQHRRARRVQLPVHLFMVGRHRGPVNAFPTLGVDVLSTHRTTARKSLAGPKFLVHVDAVDLMLV